MTDQKEKITPVEVTKCTVCGNESIKKYHNFCGKCGVQLKENPVIIDYFSQKQSGEGMDLLAEFNLPHTDSMKNKIKGLGEKHSEKEIAEAVKIARLSGRNDFTYFGLVLKNKSSVARKVDIDNS